MSKDNVNHYANRLQSPNYTFLGGRIAISC